jgi:hypothetical protein
MSKDLWRFLCSVSNVEGWSQKGGKCMYNEDRDISRINWLGGGSGSSDVSELAHRQRGVYYTLTIITSTWLPLGCQGEQLRSTVSDIVREWGR